MSAMANTTPIVATVTKPATKERMPKDADTTPKVSIQDFCEEQYEDILPVIMDKIRRDKRKEVHARLDFGESPKKRRIREDSQNSSVRTLSASDTSDGGHWKSKSKRHKFTDEDDLAVPWICDPKDHVKKFQAAAQVERWAMPTWCHMFNSTLIWAARVWFDELPPESINGYKDLKAAFLAYFMQQKKYVKDLVEIYNIKQRDTETIEEFMERFKVETGRMKGAPESIRFPDSCMGLTTLN
ncbi:reverse transcriptase domain-containing protein [Tanacetum coccineum]